MVVVVEVVGSGREDVVSKGTLSSRGGMRWGYEVFGGVELELRRCGAMRCSDCQRQSQCLFTA